MRPCRIINLAFRFHRARHEQTALVQLAHDNHGKLKRVKCIAVAGFFNEGFMTAKWVSRFLTGSNLNRTGCYWPGFIEGRQLFSRFFEKQTARPDQPGSRGIRSGVENSVAIK
jgi:hypothetical protein